MVTKKKVSRQKPSSRKPMTRKKTPARHALLAEPDSTTAPASAPAPRKVMLVIHGGGDIPENYFEPLVTGVKAKLGRDFDFISGYYSDIITEGVTSLVAPVESPEVRKFKADYEKLLRESHTRAQADNQARGIVTTSFLGIDPALADTIDEVVQYVFNRTAASRIQARVKKSFDQAKKFDEIVIVSHSLGTVVAFDVLKQFANQYNVTQWFTMGCPLVKLLKARIRPSDVGQISEMHIARWYNLYDTNDFVSDVIGAFFNVPGLYIHDIFVDNAPAMPGAHDYFPQPGIQAMIADALR